MTSIFMKSDLLQSGMLQSGKLLQSGMYQSGMLLLLIAKWDVTSIAYTNTRLKNVKIVCVIGVTWLRESRQNIVVINRCGALSMII